MCILDRNERSDFGSSRIYIDSQSSSNLEDGQADLFPNPILPEGVCSALLGDCLLQGPDGADIFCLRGGCLLSVIGYLILMLYGSE